MDVAFNNDEKNAVIVKGGQRGNPATINWVKHQCRFVPRTPRSCLEPSGDPRNPSSQHASVEQVGDWRITCQRGVGVGSVSAWQCWSASGLEGRVLDGVGRRLRIKCPSTDSCTAGTDSCVYSQWRPRFCGKLQDLLVEVPKVEQWTHKCDSDRPAAWTITHYSPH